MIKIKKPVIELKETAPSNKKIVLFTHTDMDGEGCHILSCLAFGKENVEVRYCGYDNIDASVRDFLPKSNAYDYCFVTDISVSNHLADIVDRGCYNFQLLDHHGTSTNLNRYRWCKVCVENENGIKTCGTELFYNWLLDNNFLNTLNNFQQSALKEFVEIVRCYDTWDWMSLQENGLISKNLNDLFGIYSKFQFAERCLARIRSGNGFSDLSKQDKLLLDIENRKIDSYVKQKNATLRTGTLHGYSCGVVYAERYISELGHRLCDLHPELDFIALINMNGKVSYRCQKDDLNVGKEIASLFGGGGHAQSAGSEFNIDEASKYILNVAFGNEFSLSSQAINNAESINPNNPNDESIDTEHNDNEEELEALEL